MRIYEWQLCTVLLLAMAILHDTHLFDCESLKPLKYCPEHDSARWKNRASCKNCRGNLTYHCCKDYDSPKLNCPQEDFYCEEEIFVDGCAEEIFCKEGEEPILNFIKNHERIETPELFCELCYNNNRYNDFKNKSSATFSECPYRKENICTQETHKIECSDPTSVTSDRMCRCDSENGYSPDLHPDDHPIDGCSRTDYSCVTGRCGLNEKVLLNYTCECKEGFRRNNVSNECFSDHKTSSSKSMQTKKTTNVRTSTRPKQSITETSSTSPTTSNHSATKPKEQNGDVNVIIISAVCLIMMIIIIIRGVIAYLKWKKKKNKEKLKKAVMSNIGTNTEEVTELTLLQSTNVTDGHDESDTREDTSACLQPGRPESHTELRGMDILMSEENRSPPEGRDTRKAKSDVEETETILKKLTIDELREFVKKVVQNKYTYLRDELKVTPILDHLFQNDIIDKLTKDTIESITDKAERNKKLMDSIKGPDFYKSFIEALSISKQKDCLAVLHEQEHVVYKEVQHLRKEKDEESSDEQ